MKNFNLIKLKIFELQFPLVNITTKFSMNQAIL